MQSVWPTEDDPLEMPGPDAAPGGEAAGDGVGAAADGQLAIFISHRCVVEPDRSIALRLHADLSPYGEVYVNTAESAGTRFDEEIKQSLDRADFVVALISDHANESEWVKYELSYAAGRFQRGRRPTIIPVLLGFDPANYSPRIGASVSGFNPVQVAPADYASILAQVQAAIENTPAPLDLSVAGLEGFLVGEYRQSLTRAASLDSPELRRAVESLRRERLFWAVGDPGVRNHFARTLAVRAHDLAAAEAGARGKAPAVYEVARSLSWSRADDTLVAGCVIVFTDALPSALFDDESSRDELKSLRRLAERNLVIVTASEDAFSEIEQEMRGREFAPGALARVGHGLYDEGAKLEMFRRLLDFSHASRQLTQRQHHWALHLLKEPEGREAFRTVLDKWSPSDIERFVTRHLRGVKRQGDLPQLLQRNADLDNEIHSWFVRLDDSTRCFVLALVMLPGLRREQLWDKYKLIVERLKGLDGGLSLWPLGICRQRAAPYVTTEGQLDFPDERIAEAVCREVTINFREYLIELVPLIKELTASPGREQRAAAAPGVRRAKDAEGRELRVALARLVGKAGKQGLEDFSDLLEFWGADPSLPVREAVAVALEQAVRERAGAKHALALLGRWCSVVSGRQETLYRAAAAASALSAIAAARRADGTYEKSLGLLRRLAGGAHPSMKFYVSIALRKAARRLPLDDRAAPVGLSTLLGLVARGGGRAATKINVAEALNEARTSDEGPALDLVGSWMAGEDADCRWAAMCSLVLWRRLRGEEGAQLVADLLGRDAATAASVLVEVINHKHERTTAYWDGFARLVRGADEAMRESLVSGLAALPQASLEERLLPLLRASGEAGLEGLAVEVRAERWRRMFPTPAEFIADLRREVQQESIPAEVYNALAALLRPEPWGHRRELSGALVSCFVEQRPSLDAVLTRLKAVAPSSFEPLSVEVRREGLRRLLEAPRELVAALSEGLTRAELARDTGEALAALNQPEPYGCRDRLLRALALAPALAPAPAFALLEQFRASGVPAVSQLAYELNLRSLEDDITDGGRFLSRVNEMLRYPSQRAEVLQALLHLSTPEPEGRRRALVRALGTARVTRRGEVDALLQDRSWQRSAGPLGLGNEVKLFSFVSSVFSADVAESVVGLAS